MTTRMRFAAWAACSGAIAVVLAGIVAIGVVDRSLLQVVDDRVDSLVDAVRVGEGTVEQACVRVEGAAGSEPQRRVVSLLVAGREACRSSSVAPSPRVLGVDSTGNESGRSTRLLDGRPWRVRVVDAGADRTLVAAELDEAGRRASSNARRAIVLAMGIGVLVALAAGVVASVPATRRITRLLDRIGVAVRDRRRRHPVAGGLGRDLDVAAASFDELLDGMRQAEGAQRRLFADAAHQLRTPVTSIRTNAQLLERSPSLDDEARDIAARLARQAGAIGDLVSGLVDYAAVPAWSTERGVATPLRDIAEDAAQRASARWPDADLAVTGDESTAEVDGELVVRAIGNLIDNAIEHGGPGVRILVEDGVVAVEDDGSGFPAELVDSAFEPFAGRGGGAGIGLAFVAHVAHAHDGEVRIVAGPPTRVELDLRRP